MIKGVKFVNIPVHDQDRALAFYTEKLGCRVATDAPMGPGQRWIELAFPRAETEIALFTAPGQEAWIGQLLNISFWTDDVFATAAELESRGVEFVRGPQEGAVGLVGNLQGLRRESVRAVVAVGASLRDCKIADAVQNDRW